MKDDKYPYYYISDGGVEMHETSRDAIVREINKEIEIESKINRLLWTVRNLFVEKQSGDSVQS